MSASSASLRQVLTRQFLTVGVLPLLAVALLAAAVLVPLLVAQAQQRQMELAIAIRDQISAQLVDYLHSATVIARQVTGGGADAGAYGLLRSMVEVDPILLAVYVADGQGEVRAAAIRPASGRSEADAVGLDISAQPYFIEARRLRTPVWSDVFVSTLTGRVTAMLVVPQAEDTLLLELSLESMSHALAAVSRDRSTLTAIVDRQGRIVAHPDVALALQQQRLPQLGAPGPDTARGQAAGWLRPAAWWDDPAVQLPVEPVGWTVVVSRPLHLTLAPALLLGAGLAGVVLLTGLLATLAARRYARRTSGQVEQLAAAAAQAARQAPSTTPPAFEVRELDVLWQHLQALFGQLHERDLAVRTAHRDLQNLLDTASLVAIYASGLDGRVTLFNHGAERLLARPAGDVVGHVDALAWHEPQELAAAAAAAGIDVTSAPRMLEALAAGGPERRQGPRDWTFLRPDGTRVPVSLAVTPMLDAAGACKGYLFVGVDVSARQRATELEVAHRVAQLASQAKSEFLSKMSHELRTPLNAILGFAELLQTGQGGPLAPGQQQQLRYMQEAGWHLLELISDVLDLARIESGSLKVELTAIDLGELMPRVAHLVEAAMGRHAVRLSLEPCPDPAGTRVLADETRLTQVLVNLLSNAAKYNRPGGSVTVSCARDGARVLLHIRDTGQGMTAEQLSHLFEPFNRLGRERSRIEGTGIGLVISRQLMELMGGTLSADSEVGVGTVFTLALAAAGDEPHAPAAPAAASALAAGAPAARPQRVLYVEDNDVNVLLMQAMLQRRPGLALEVADSAASALDQARAATPDLILLDMHLPDSDGLEVLQRIRAEASLRDVPVVAVTADASAERERSAAAAGVQAYLKKPLRLEDTLRVIDEALAKGH